MSINYQSTHFELYIFFGFAENMSDVLIDHLNENLILSKIQIKCLEIAIMPDFAPNK